MTAPRELLEPPPLTSTRHPATFGAFGAALAAGAWGLLVPGGQSNAVDQALPVWYVAAYYAALGLGGLAGLVALSLRDQDDRVRAERAAWYVIGWFSLFYAAAAFVIVGAPAGQAAIFVGAYSAVATARIVQISVQRRSRPRAPAPDAAGPS